MIRMIKRLIDAAEGYKGRIYKAFVFSFFKTVLSKAPIIIGFFVITGFIDGDFSKRKCLYAGIAMAVCLIAQIVCQHMADRLQSGAGFELFADMRMKLGEHLRHLPMGYFTEGNIGKISSVLSTDMVFIEENCMMTIADMMNYLFSQLIMIVFLMIFDIRIGLAALCVCILMLALGRRMTKDSLKHSVIRQQKSEELTESVLDFAEGIGIVKAYNLLGDRQEALSGNFRESCDSSLAFEETQSAWTRRMFLLWAAGTVAVLGLCTWLFFGGALETGIYVGILLFIFDLFIPLRTFYSQIARLTVMDSCLTRIESVFEEAKMPDEGTDHLDEDAPETEDVPEIEFRDVRFSYGSKEVLHGISFAVNENEMAALAGPSGGGKSTIGSLVARLWDVDSGQVLIRGKDIRDVPLAELMQQISMVFQRVYLFKDTVYNNIAMGRPDAGSDEVIEAAKKARCHDFIMKLPDGYDTVIGEGGASLSGGEIQRISIARCILKDTPIVILDEATASVDADNERYIQQAITELVRGKTLIVIAHRLNTIRNADQILIVDDGMIAERGTHEELMMREGIYKSMVMKQKQASGKLVV